MTQNEIEHNESVEASFAKLFKVSHALGCRPLLRTGLIRSCLIAEKRLGRCCTGRFLSDKSNGEEDEEGRLSGRIHILGLGNVGVFVAHSLAARQSRPPLTLMLHNRHLYHGWVEKRKSLSLSTRGLDDIKTGFDLNVRNNETWYSVPATASRGVGKLAEEELSEKLLKRTAEETLAEAWQDNRPIECLIVACKAPDTVTALRTVKHRLTRDSTVLLLQNGMGAIDDINELVFPNPGERPHYMSGVISHGLTGKGAFQAIHVGLGTVTLGPVPPATPATRSIRRNEEEDWALTTKYLLRTLTMTPPLVAFAVPYTDLIQYQLEKLALNCVINPLTALLGCLNGEPLYHLSFSRVLRLLLIEISSVICTLPELQGVPGIEHRFSVERLRSMAVSLMNKTGKNTNSMLQDIRAGKKTEIRYLNGYIVRRGEELGIKCPLNYMIIQLLSTKQGILSQTEEDAIPIKV